MYIRVLMRKPDDFKLLHLTVQKKTLKLLKKLFNVLGCGERSRIITSSALRITSGLFMAIVYLSKIEGSSRSRQKYLPPEGCFSVRDEGFLLNY